MRIMDTMSALAQGYVEIYGNLVAKRRKYVLDETFDFAPRWTDTNELADPSEVNAEFERFNVEVRQSVTDLRDRAYLELNIKDKYRVSKRVFDVFFVNSRRYTEDRCATYAMDDVEYWEEVLSGCVDMCELVFQAIEDEQTAEGK